LISVFLKFLLKEKKLWIHWYFLNLWHVFLFKLMKIQLQDWARTKWVIISYALKIRTDFLYMIHYMTILFYQQEKHLKLDFRRIHIYRFFSSYGFFQNKIILRIYFLLIFGINLIFSLAVRLCFWQQRRPLEFLPPSSAKFKYKLHFLAKKILQHCKIFWADKEIH